MAAPVLVIEDGTVVTSANSYVTKAEVETFCNDFGLTFTTNATLAVQAIIRGCAFVDSEYDFKGEKYSYDDPMEWPRVGIYDDVNIDPSVDMEYYLEIPNALKKACCRAAYEEAAVPGTLQSNLSTGIRREKVDVIETEYFGNSPSRTVYRVIEGFLKGLLKSRNTATILRT